MILELDQVRSGRSRLQARGRTGQKVQSPGDLGVRRGRRHPRPHQQPATDAATNEGEGEGGRGRRRQRHSRRHGPAPPAGEPARVGEAGKTVLRSARDPRRGPFLPGRRRPEFPRDGVRVTGVLLPGHRGVLRLLRPAGVRDIRRMSLLYTGAASVGRYARAKKRSTIPPRSSPRWGWPPRSSASG